MPRFGTTQSKSVNKPSNGGLLNTKTIGLEPKESKSADLNTEATGFQPGSGKEVYPVSEPQDGGRSMGSGDFSLCEKADSVVPLENKMSIQSAQPKSAAAKEEGSTFEVDNCPKLSYAVDTAVSETEASGKSGAAESPSISTAYNKEDEETEQASTDDFGPGWLCVIL